MKKIFTVLAVVLTMMFSTTAIFAANSVKATYSGTNIVIEGTSNSDTIQVAVFNPSNAPIYTATYNDVDPAAFKITLPVIEGLTDGTYTVKIADYNGNDTTSASLVIKTANSGVKTGDSNNIILYSIIGITSLLALSAFAFFRFRKSAQN